jgi:hypothetical protein
LLNTEVHTCNLGYTRGRGRRIAVEVWLRTKSVKNKLIQIGLKGVAQVVEHFPSKHRAPSSNPSTIKKFVVNFGATTKVKKNMIDSLGKDTE